MPDYLAVLKLHYLRPVLFPIKGKAYFGIFDFNRYTGDAMARRACRTSGGI
jgi:hypothetical protein